MSASLAANIGRLLVWGLVATMLMTTILQASQGLGLSRLSLPFLVGTMFTAKRSFANIIGFLAYAIGGWIFALVYVVFFLSIDYGSWWLGILFGFAHALVLLIVLLPLIAYVHPRMANEYDGPTRTQRLEPPGFMGLNYGYRTPVTVCIAQAAYGGVLGLCFQLAWVSA